MTIMAFKYMESPLAKYGRLLRFQNKLKKDINENTITVSLNKKPRTSKTAKGSMIDARVYKKQKG